MTLRAALPEGIAAALAEAGAEAARKMRGGIPRKNGRTP